MISQIVGILYESQFMGFLGKSIFSYQWPEMHTWVVILLLCLTPTRGTVFVPLQQWKQCWGINLKVTQLCQRTPRNSLCATLRQIQRKS